jgi:acylphosphatase
MTQTMRLEAVVKGRVQGVGFRYHVLQLAREMGITGYVRNLWDGSVEVVAEGDKVKLDRLLAYLQVGPRSAWVREVTTNWQAASGEFHSFEVRF